MTDKKKTRRDESDEPKDTNLGYAQGAGHPGGEQELDEKTETEAEHDTFGTHE